MDRFVTITRQKECDEIIGRDVYIKNIKSLVEQCRSFCVYGPTGVGKTFLLKHALRDFTYIELTSETLKTADRFRHSKIHILADEVSASEPMSLGSTIVVSDCMMENFECMKIEKLTVENLVSIGTKKFPDVDHAVVERHATSSNGDVRAFLYALDNFTHDRDMFKTTKDFVYDLVCKGGCLDPRDFLGSTVVEHGYSWGIVHENYPDAEGIDIAKVADMMSLADIKDEELYTGGHTHGDIFSLFGILLPAIDMNHSLDRKTMRPGSAWTKFNNYKMRHRRYQDLACRTRLDVDALSTISQYCRSQPNDVVPLLKHYGFDTGDVDMMNHISIIHKVKPRVLQNIKSKLKLST